MDTNQTILRKIPDKTLEYCVKHRNCIGYAYNFNEKVIWENAKDGNADGWTDAEIPELGKLDQRTDHFQQAQIKNKFYSENGYSMQLAFTHNKVENETSALRSLNGCTGLVCYNDQIAFAFCAELRKNKLRVPDDLSIVGVDNSDLAALCEVPFTSVAHPMKRLGKAAAENLLRLIADPHSDATVKFDPQLVKRNSVRGL